MNALAPSLSSDGELVAATRAGVDQAFEELYRRYQRRIAAYVHRIVGDPGRAEDVTQEAFLSALRRLRATDSEIAFRPWIYEIARNASIDAYRRSSRAEEVPMDASDRLRSGDRQRLVGGASPDSAVLDKERLGQLRDALAELTENHHRILVLRELEGLSYREIAERMELTRPAVESTLFRARRRLEEEYSELDTGRRCATVCRALARLAEGIDSARDRRRVGRHLRHCAGCRREAHQLGVTSLPQEPLRSKVAAVLPLPALFGRRGRTDSDVGPARAAVDAGAARLAPFTGLGAEATTAAWAKAAAMIAAVAIIGGTAVGTDRAATPEGGSAPASSPAASPLLDPPFAAARSATPGERTTFSPPSAGATSEAAGRSVFGAEILAPDTASAARKTGVDGSSGAAGQAVRELERLSLPQDTGSGLEETAAVPTLPAIPAPESSLPVDAGALPVNVPAAPTELPVPITKPDHPGVGVGNAMASARRGIGRKRLNGGK